MITPDQEKWLQHLSNDHPTKIIPYNPIVKQAFQQVKSQIQSVLGPTTDVQHRGASSMGISGKGDLDVYIPTPPELFNQQLEKLTNHFGQPGSHYPLQRARWNIEVMRIESEIFLSNNQDKNWLDSVAFETYLKTHPDALDQYRLLKEQAQGLGTQDYYRQKTAFINHILSLVASNK